jgi:hypothetical protein
MGFLIDAVATWDWFLRVSARERTKADLMIVHTRLSG